MTAAAWRPLGFLLLMLGFGLRLDSEWLGLANALLALGAVAGGAGLWALRREAPGGAFVPPASRR
jgi:hypothetical protein